jgi:hypothetical protein
MSDKLQDITVVESESGDDAGSESSEEFNFCQALALRKNLAETFDKQVHASSVSAKIARFENESKQSCKLPPRPVNAATNTNTRSRPNINNNSTGTALGVYLRVRPLPAATSTSTANTLEIQPTVNANHVPTTIRTYPPVDSNAAKVLRTSDTEGVKEFQFSQVLGPDSSQQDVYSTVAAPLVTGLFPNNNDQKPVGESALLFAYGITNAGKTHTIMGDVKETESNLNWGIIPRTLQDIFAHMENFNNTSYSLNLSYMEIYNEHIYDLLPKQTKSNSCFGNRTPLKLRESRDGQIFCRGLAKRKVKNVAHGLQLAQQAGTMRHTSSNNLNSDSSRSHCICQLELTIVDPVHPAVATNNDDNQDETASTSGYTTDEEASHLTKTRDKTVTLWIVDLAGSERSKRTGVMQGSVRQKEAALINSSLMKLMRCLSVMRRNQSLSSTSNVVPFRESKLTHLFMNHLTGPCANRTVMVVNVNPAVADFDETQHVLAYATAARTVQISQEEFRRKRKDMNGGGEMEATHDNNGRALKRFKSSTNPPAAAKPNNNIARLVRHFSPKKFMAKKTTHVDERKRKVEHKVPSENREPITKAARLATMRAAGKPKVEHKPSNEKELSNLKTMLSIAQAEAEVLRSEKNELEEQLSQQETLVRMEIAQEMEEQMRVTREQYNDIIDKLKRQVQTNPTPAPKSTRKAQIDKAELYIEELVDKVDECEEEMVRMRQEHVKEVTTLKEQHAKVVDAKDQELKDLEKCHVEAIGKLKETVEDLKTQLNQSTENYGKLERSKKEMMENYERLFREEEEEDEESDDDEEEEEDPTPVRRGRQNETTGSKRLPRSSRRCSEVAVDSVDLENVPSTAKKNGRRNGSKRMPFSSVANNENPASENSDDSFDPDKWLRPRKPVEQDGSTGAYLRPRGRAPSGREWDENVGAWRLDEIA